MRQPVDPTRHLFGDCSLHFVQWSSVSLCHIHLTRVIVYPPNGRNDKLLITSTNNVTDYYSSECDVDVGCTCSRLLTGSGWGDDV